MEIEKLASRAVGSSVVFVSFMKMGNSELHTFKTVGVWPEDRISIANFAVGSVVCASEGDVAECVSHITPKSDKEALLAFIRQAMPSSCFVIDDTLPQSLAAGIEAEWNVPFCEGDSLVLFVNDGESESVFRWSVEGENFNRKCVGPGIEVMRA